MTLTLQPNAELVATAWIAAISGFSSAMVATQLPADESTWQSSGFVTVKVVGGSPAPLIPTHAPVMQVDCWAVKPGSNKPPWFKANALAQAIWLASMQTFGKEVALTAGGVSYPSAVVDTVTVTTEPRRKYGDIGKYACYTFDAQFRWRTPSQVIA